MTTETIKWVNGCVRIIDQTKLPTKLVYINCKDVKTLWDAIKVLKVRGAPALGVAAGFGILLSLKTFKGTTSKDLMKHVFDTAVYIGTSRPTAVNLFNVLDLMKRVVVENQEKSVTQLKEIIKETAIKVFEEDRATCRKMGNYGAKLIKNGFNCLTVCNAGALATADYGTALGVFYSAKKINKKFKVYSCETRPLLQGSRLTCWELTRGGVDTTLICDNMAATLMKQGKVDIIFTGADRIASNGDAANKIGTYMLAVLAKYHKIPFYVVAPKSTFDLEIKTGKEIPIEERKKEEVMNFQGVQTAPSNIKVFNPAFDVTDNKLITGIITEYGIISPVNSATVKKVLKG